MVDEHDDVCGSRRSGLSGRPERGRRCTSRARAPVELGRCQSLGVEVGDLGRAAIDSELEVVRTEIGDDAPPAVGDHHVDVDDAHPESLAEGPGGLRSALPAGLVLGAQRGARQQHQEGDGELPGPGGSGAAGAASTGWGRRKHRGEGGLGAGNGPRGTQRQVGYSLFPPLSAAQPGPSAETTTMNPPRLSPTTYWAGALLALLFAAPSWGQGASFRGTVVDEQGVPISGVQITVTAEKLSSYTKTVTTNKNGGFRLRFLPNQLQYRFDLLFEKSGFESFIQPISPSATKRDDETFTMQRAAVPVAETHGDLAAVVTGTDNVAIAAFNEGLTAQRAGDLQSARSKLEEAVAADPTLGPAQIALSQVLLDQGEHEGALAAADRALALQGDAADALKVKVQALQSLGRADEAKAASERLKEASDDAAAARILYNEGSDAFQAEDHDTALARFREAAGLDPSLIEAHHAIATLELAAGRHEAAAEAAERALALGSSDVRTLRVLFNAYEALGRSEQLAEIAPRLAAVDPDFGAAKLVEQAAGLWNAGQSERAVALSRLALRADPSLAKPYYFIGLDHISGGRNAEAREALTKFISLAPDDPDAAAAREMIEFLE